MRLKTLQRVVFVMSTLEQRVAHLGKRLMKVNLGRPERLSRLAVPPETVRREDASRKRLPADSGSAIPILLRQQETSRS